MRRRAGLLIGLGLLAFLLRLPGLGGPLWFDEVQLLVEVVREPLAVSLAGYRSDNNHPLYSLLAWSSARLLGESPWVLRLPALLFGVASVLLTCALGRRLGTFREGMLAALILATSDHHVWFSQNARGYTGLLALSLLATLLFLRLLDSPGRGILAAYALAMALATYVHLTGVYVACAHLVVGLVPARGTVPLGLHGRARRTLAGVGLAALISLLLHAPMLREMAAFFLGWQEGDRVRAAWRSPLWMLEATRESLGLGSVVFSALLLLAGGLGLVLGAWWVRREPRVVALLLLPPLLGFAVSLGLGRNLWPRFFFFAAGFLAILLVRGTWLLATALRPGVPRFPATLSTLLVALLVLAFAWRLPRTWSVPKQDFAAAVRWLDARGVAPEAVATVGLAIQPYEWLYEPRFRPVRSAAALEAAQALHPDLHVLHTLPEFLRGRDPELARLLETRFREVHRIPATVGGGEVSILARAP
jgi:mannosyltransferase